MSTLGAPSPVRNDVKQRLRDAIAQRYQPGDRLPSTRDISSMLSVAHGTAYRALCELHHEGVIKLVPRRGAFVALTKAGGGRALKDYRVTPYITLGNIFTAEMFDGFKQGTVSAGLNVEPVLLPPPVDGVPVSREALEIPAVDASVHFNPSIFAPLSAAPTQSMLVVTTSADLPAIQTARLDVVSVDQELGGRLAGQALRAAGCDAVFFIGVREAELPGLRGYRMTCGTRLTGFERGWDQRIPPEHLSYQTGYGVPPGMLAFEEYRKLNPRPRGVFCSTDELAGGFVLRAAVHGMAPGRDFEIIGFDGQERIRSLLGFALPTIVVPTRDMGLRAADMLLDRLTHPDQPARRLLLGCSLRGMPLFKSEIHSSRPSST